MTRTKPGARIGGKIPDVKKLSVTSSASSLSAKARRKRRSRPRLTTYKCRSKKARPGFDAFEVKQKTPTGIKIEVISPEDGIHSLNWAIQTPPQPGADFLKLPIEIRNRIYGLVLCPARNFGMEYIVIPRKALKKFINVSSTIDNPNTIIPYNILSIVCRQFYIDVIGGSLLYKWTTFEFTSINLMANYLQRVNPAHRDQIRSVKVSVRASDKNPNLPLALFRTLATLRSLMTLQVNVLVDSGLCEITSFTFNGGQIDQVLRPPIVEKFKSQHWTLLKHLNLQDFIFLVQAYEIPHEHIHGYFNREKEGMPPLRKEIRKLIGMNEDATWRRK
ncbi:hypothetical protein G7Y89_g6005 [Cudoniella acicularis]|uniref:Uncharacterized protein n=1 Tax=Cudoniella acicularis TaxID=354080 RepID=A0A8H4RNK9_9HELO|nr:hypothetical protein G7Y89_g6005 [Cudoniella acicularis]